MHLRLSNPKDGRLIINGKERPALKWLREYITTHKHPNARSGAWHIATVPRAASPMQLTYTDNGFLTVEFNSPKSLLLQMVDPAGRCVGAMQQRRFGSGVHTIPLSAFPVCPGSYFLTAKSDRAQSTVKITVAAEQSLRTHR